MKKLLHSCLLSCLLLVTGVSLFLPPTAFGEDHRERDHWHGQIGYFHEHDLGIWRSGHWYTGNHMGRRGSWWVVNGIWYYYPTQVATIPDPYIPPTVNVQVQTPPPATATTVVYQQPPSTPAPVAPQTVPPPPAQMPTSPQSWYYCNNPHGYYPYVTSCMSGWVSVPAQPPTAPPAQ